ncbi:MAG TPA: histidine kinase [Candidatus Limnocylindrales bacterium]|nr:histidine kinase [Candidatus Limnocylindrales bacterium]
MPDATTAVALTPAALAARLQEEARAVQSELEEIELLISQATSEAARHETRRVAAAEKLAIAAEKATMAEKAAGAGHGSSSATAAGKEVADLANQLVTVGRKASLMEAQIDLLEGKRKSIIRLHEVLTRHAAEIAGFDADWVGGSAGAGTTNASGSGDGPGRADDGRLGGGEALGVLDVTEGGAVPPGVARIVLAAQEDLRREIARAMHDGPAQSLTNIVLQAQILERLVAKDPAEAATEVHALTKMVQRTLDATKTFIFDVRPMVLDDLGLVPTLRRASRDRGARARIKVDFESVGVDRRLSPDLESGLFRMLDDALAAHVAGRPERLSLHLDWGERLEAELTAGKTMAEVEKPDLPDPGAELPPALAAMVDERRAAYEAALEAARVASLARLPDRVWREIAERSALLGIQAELLDEGARLHLAVPLPAA